MMRRIATRGQLREVGIEGGLFAVAPLPLMAAGWLPVDDPGFWRIALSILTAILLFSAGLLITRRPAWGRGAAIAALVAGYAAMVPWLLSSPFIALTVTVSLIALAVNLGDHRVEVTADRVSTHGLRCLQRAAWACGAGIVAAALHLLVGGSHDLVARLACAAIVLIALILVYQWLWTNRRPPPWLRILGLGLLLACLLPALLRGLIADTIGWPMLLLMVGSWLVLPKGTCAASDRQSWWIPLIDHPARMLVSTFLLLCVAGAGLLLLPGMTTRADGLPVIDAVFTSVSAVCVTGLVVADTPVDFTFYGQAGILLLIQLGGLGIMTISTVALHAFGRRMSLRQERLLHSLSEEDGGDLLGSLVTVVRFTFFVEGLGALLLFLLFLSTSGEPWPTAAWRALFTSISAFCNAGFALQSDSLVSFAGAPLVLHAVALLIILGGMAPAVALALPRWCARRPVPTGAHLVIVTTLVLLLVGFVAILALEWGRTLDALSPWDKIHNAWFQSVTLRTAGFNSIDIAAISAPTLMIMLAFMFIGGSPGGTAGGVKTTTVAVLALAMWANVTGHREIVIKDRHIAPGLVFRAIAVVGSGLAVWFVLVLALEITQEIPVRDLIFEATSALGTVGLSTNTTGRLDGIGKVLIILGMFLGRVGPMTLFMLLGDEPRLERQHRPEARIPIS
jgi:trk system potassium uptake protein TrkH